MGKTFLKGLGAATVGVMLFLMNFHISSCKTGAASSTDTSGHPPVPKYRIVTKGFIPAGSKIILEFPTISSDTSSPSGSGTPPKPRRVTLEKLPFDVPKNTVIILTFPPETGSVRHGKGKAPR